LGFYSISGKKQKKGVCAQITHFCSPIALQNSSFYGTSNSAQKMPAMDENAFMMPKNKKK
jgi:hypothetical protein